MTAYSTYQDVLDALGYNLTDLASIMSKTEAQISTLIAGYITTGDARLKKMLKVPISIQTERHIGDGRTLQYQLGPEDEDIGIFTYDPENCVEDIFAVYHFGSRVKLPYPKDCDSITEATASSYGKSNAVVSDDTSVIKCGVKSIKAIFSAAGYISYPSAADLDKNVFPWTYIAFWFRSSDASATFTFKLYDKDGNEEYKTFTVDKANVWKAIRLNIEEFTGSIDWSDVNLFQFRIYADKVCTIYFDNFNFNEGWWWTTPKGTINYGGVSDGIGWFSLDDIVKVTYSFDPYKASTPEEVKYCSARLAALALVEYLIGIRQQHTAFEFETETMEPKSDKWTLEVTRNRLQKEFDETLAAIGYGGTTGTSS